MGAQATALNIGLGWKYNTYIFRSTSSDVMIGLLLNEILCVVQRASINK
jgi:hypothetical protein